MHAEILILIGALTPLIVAAVASVKWSSQAKGLLALLCSVVIGFGTAWASGAIDPANVAAAALAALGAAQTVYVVAFKPLGITSWVLEHIGNVQAGDRASGD